MITTFFELVSDLSPRQKHEFVVSDYSTLQNTNLYLCSDVCVYIEVCTVMCLLFVMMCGYCAFVCLCVYLLLITIQGCLKCSAEIEHQLWHKCLSVCVCLSICPSACLSTYLHGTPQLPLAVTRKVKWYICISSNTTPFLGVCLLILRHNYMFRPSILAIFMLYMRNLSISYTNVCGEFIVCGWGRCEISFVSERGAWTGAVQGSC